jgi:peptide/nickel transport system permease protein
MTSDAIVSDQREPLDLTERRPFSISFKIGIAITSIFVLVAILAPWIAPYDPLEQDVLNRLASPSAEHLLGTDQLGRDVFSRLIHASRTDLPIGFLAALFPLVIGSMVGIIAGHYGRWVDALLMRIADVVQAFPSYVVIVTLAFFLGAGAFSIILAFAILGWVPYARLVRGEILHIRELDFIQAAHVSGLSEWRVLFRHVVPNASGQAVVFFVSDIVLAIMAITSFSFLGLGIPPPTPEWGAMINEGRLYMREQWWLTVVPGLVILSVGIGLSMIGDAIEERIGD